MQLQLIRVEPAAKGPLKEHVLSPPGGHPQPRMLIGQGETPAGCRAQIGSADDFGQEREGEKKSFFFKSLCFKREW